MSRGAQVVTVCEVLSGRPNGAAMPLPPVEATATLAHARCWCGAVLATVVRPHETAGDVVDAMLRDAGWDPAHDLCPECQLTLRDEAAMRGQRDDGCPMCARRCR